MSDSGSQRDRAKHFVKQVKAKLISEFGDSVQFENDQPTNLKFVINSKEMMLEYKNGDDFELYDRDARTQKGTILGKYSSANITNPTDSTPDNIIAKIKKYIS